MNNQNLKPFGTQSESKEREMRSKGGKRSGETRRQRRLCADTIAYLLSISITDPKMKKQLKDLGIKENLDYETAMIAGQVLKAINERDTNATRFLLDYRGDMLKLQEQQQQQQAEESQLIIESHNDMINEINLNLQNPPQTRDIGDFENE